MRETPKREGKQKEDPICGALSTSENRLGETDHFSAWRSSLEYEYVPGALQGPASSPACAVIQENAKRRAFAMPCECVPVSFELRGQEIRVVAELPPAMARFRFLLSMRWQAYSPQPLHPE